MRNVPGVVFFATSVFINSALYLSFDRAMYFGERHLELQKLKLNRENDSKVQFEFVEAPAKTHPQNPARRTRKISDRDALNQDLIRDKARAETLPKVETQGPSDQLAQRRMSGIPQPPVPPVKPRKEIPEEKARTGKNEEAAKTSEFAARPAEPLLKNTPSESLKNVKKQSAQAPSVPVPSGLTGQDKITTQAISRSASHGAQFYGITSFEATGSGMGEYMKNLKEKVWLSWFPYLAFKYPTDFRTSDAVIRFTLNQKGEVKIIEIVESEGSPLFASFCADAIQRASGFGEIPKEILALIGKDELELKFAFHYR